jgi:aldose 1-epimerase
MTDETEIELVAGPWSAVVSAFGASLRGVTCAGRPVVTGYRGTANKVGGQGDVLIPFPGRVKGARYMWDGSEYHLPLTDKDGPNAIHGFVRTVLWHTGSVTTDTATFSHAFAGADGYPFPLQIDVTYLLDADGLSVHARVTNTGGQAAPLGVGFHPYFTVGSARIDGDLLTLPFAEVLEFEQLIPTGRVSSVAAAGLDFRTARPIGDTVLNHCFLSPTRDVDGRTRVRLSQGERTVVVWMDEAFDYVVLYSGDALVEGARRTALAIEPMSCGSDAFNHPEWGLTRLEPGAVSVMRWGVALGA